MKIRPEIIQKLTNTFSITVKTNQKTTDLQLKNNEIIVFVKEKPENNKANQEIERFLTKITGKQAKIIGGKTSKKKTIRLQ